MKFLFINNKTEERPEPTFFIRATKTPTTDGVLSLEISSSGTFSDDDVNTLATLRTNDDGKLYIEVSGYFSEPFKKAIEISEEDNTHIYVIGN